MTSLPGLGFASYPDRGNGGLPEQNRNVHPERMSTISEPRNAAAFEQQKDGLGELRPVERD
jgi:hypothetical protein